MRQIETPSGYLAIERIGGIDVYLDDCFVCELCHVTLDDFREDCDPNDGIDTGKLEDAIEDELDTEAVMETITDPYNFL